ncbi:carbamoyltransferase C-terminal domain-containing protein [Sunxiuqinia sp. A32]|uniref:carbamoyltransferase C-terminal domain-containing protein n=1 Tax=Sunxiuqinia sp. A32 TaxID=3461496 RepID=UPI0040459462
MNPDRATLAIYGIQDWFEYEHPFYVHDHNLCIMRNGKVEHFLQLERITRRKRDNKLYEEIYSILKKKKLLAEDFDLVFVDNVVGRTFLTSKGDARFEAPLNNQLATSLEKGRCWWFGREANAWVLNHELSHVFSCLPFFGNFKQNSLLVHFDGGASLSNFSAWLYRGNKITKITAHWDYQYLSSIFNSNALVFAVIGAKLSEQNSVPGKMMGLAGHGKYRPELEEWLRKNDFFKDIWGKTSIFFKQVAKDWNIELKSFDQKNPFILDCMATFHEIFVQETIHILKMLQAQTDATYLYYTGGCALNIVANTRIIQQNIFKEVFIPPCTEDSGLALGAAAFAEWEKHGSVQMHSPYLNNWNLPGEDFEYTIEDIQKVAEQLANGKVIGICNGNGEAGPRALGNRSLLCLSNDKKLAQKLSMTHKGREWYRPVAPVMLEKNAKYFTGKKTIHPLSQYMLLDFDILPERQKELIGGVHIDGTSRIQTVFNKEQNPFLWDLLTYMDEKHQIKALINTSFNSKGKPIVHTQEDAISSAKKMDIDGVVLQGKLMILKGN